MTVNSMQPHLTHKLPDGGSMFFQHNAGYLHMFKNNCGGGGGCGDDDGSVTDTDNEEQEHITVIKNKFCSP